MTRNIHLMSMGQKDVSTNIHLSILSPFKKLRLNTKVSLFFLIFVVVVVVEKSTESPV